MMPTKEGAMATLFDKQIALDDQHLDLAPGAVLLRTFATERASALLEELEGIVARSPFRRMVTPGGFEMSVEMTNCGPLGWVTDRNGYRYSANDPLSNTAWPAMPIAFEELAQEAAAESGFRGFKPDACLINRYEPKSRLSLHQDKNETNFKAPIVSVSFGLPARFLFGGQQRSDPTTSVPLHHGDVVVWGGPARLNYHGVAPIREGVHALTGSYRINLTFRCAA
jgi:alkylated DNA repair protein (DNA oxidative demethylase)